MNDDWEQIYAQLPHHEKINGKWYLVGFGGEFVSEVSQERAEQLEREREFWEREWEKLAKELEEATDEK